MGSKAFYQDNPYLDYWKKELDDESINKDVLKTLLTKKKTYDKILDIGTGSGVQIRRDIELGLLRNKGLIVGIDVNKDDLKKSILSFKIWAKKKGFNLKTANDSEAIHKFTLSRKDKCFTVVLFDESVYDLGTQKSKVKGMFSLVTGLSLLEHTDMNKSLESIKKVMKTGGLLYLSINYDQHSVFGPTNKDKFKDESNLMQLFNYSGIDNQFKGNVRIGNSHCGSLLPVIANETGFKILAYGASDWIVLPGKVKAYSTNKRKVLEFFLNAFYNVLKGSSNDAKRKFSVSDPQIKEWYKLRMKQLMSGELYYSCVQKDILCMK